MGGLHVFYYVLKVYQKIMNWIVFANGPGDLGSISSRVIPDTLKMVLDTS